MTVFKMKLSTEFTKNVELPIVFWQSDFPTEPSNYTDMERCFWP